MPLAEKFRDQLEEQLLWFVTINGEFSGVLSCIRDDYVVLVNEDCKVTEIPIDEISSIEKKAIGCPD